MQDEGIFAECARNRHLSVIIDRLTHLQLDLADLFHDGGIGLLHRLPDADAAGGVLGDAALLVESRFITAWEECRKGVYNKYSTNYFYTER